MPTSAEHISRSSFGRSRGRANSLGGLRASGILSETKEVGADVIEAAGSLIWIMHRGGNNGDCGGGGGDRTSSCLGARNREEGLSAPALKRRRLACA